MQSDQAEELLVASAAVAQGLERIATEIAERGHPNEELALVGIRRGGEPLARELARLLTAKRGREVRVGSVDITLYRDDAATALPSPRIGPSHIPFDIVGSRIVLVDDVLYTGRTIRAALDALLDYGRPRRIELAVVADRGGRELPIQADYSIAETNVAEGSRVEVLPDGDGFRDLPNGQPLVLNMQFATQGIAGQVVELIGQHWANVGIKTTVKEVTPDEYRSAQSSNQLDVGLWEKGQPVGIILGNNELWVPPFENYFGHRTGMLWAEWVDSNGASGVEPPDFVKALIEDINGLQSTPAGTDEFKAIAGRMVENMTGNLLFIGTALTPDPIYHRNALKNFTEFKTASYEYYRTYPYRAQQWWFDE